MNLPKTIFFANVFILTSILILSPVIGSISINNAKIDTKDVSESTHIEIYVGQMFIVGDGDINNAEATSISEQKLIIPVPLEGTNVEFYANYYINCAGWNDHGYVYFQMSGTNIQQADWGEGGENSLRGCLYTTLYCKPGDIIQWTLTSRYYPYLLDPSAFLQHVDGGYGIFSISHPYSYAQKLPLASLLDIFSNRQISIRGNIIFK